MSEERCVITTADTLTNEELIRHLRIRVQAARDGDERWARDAVTLMDRAATRLYEQQNAIRKAPCPADIRTAVNPYEGGWHCWKGECGCWKRAVLDGEYTGTDA